MGIECKMLAVAAYQNIKCVDARDNAMLRDVRKSVILRESANKVELLEPEWLLRRNFFSSDFSFLPREKVQNVA